MDDGWGFLGLGDVRCAVQREGVLRGALSNRWQGLGPRTDTAGQPCPYKLGQTRSNAASAPTLTDTTAPRPSLTWSPDRLGSPSFRSCGGGHEGGSGGSEAAGGGGREGRSGGSVVDAAQRCGVWPSLAGSSAALTQPNHWPPGRRVVWAALPACHMMTRLCCAHSSH